jgi:hypothetical protein
MPSLKRIDVRPALSSAWVVLIAPLIVAVVGVAVVAVWHP